MAIGTFTFEQEPIGDSDKLPVITNWNPVVPYTAKQTSITSIFYFRFILEVRLTDASGELLAKIKQRQNGVSSTTNVYAVFDVRDIVNSVLFDTTADYNLTTKSIHTLGVNVIAKPFSQNNNQLRTIYVKGYQEFSSAQNASPSEYTTSSANDTKFYMQASLDLNTARGTADFQTTSFSSFQLDGSSKRVLSDLASSYNSLANVTGYINVIRSTDYHTIAFLNGATDLDSSGWYWQIKYYNSSNALIGSAQEIQNHNTTGGAKPVSTEEVNTDAERLIYFGCGPGNLQAQSATTGARPSAFSGWAYYTIQALDSSGGTAKSALYYFVKNDDNCKGYDVRRLGWRNSLGCYDYFNFTKKSTQTLEITRNNYETMLGEFNSTSYSYDNFGRGVTTRQTTAKIKETLNTDWITPEDAVLLESLLVSTNVHIIENDFTTYTVPVTITDTSFIKKTNANDGLIQYTINIEYSNPVNTNS